MSRQVSVITNRLDVVVNVRIDVRAALLVINAALHNVEQMRDHAARRESLTVIVKVKAPRVGESTSKHFVRFSNRVVTPDASIDELSL